MSTRPLVSILTPNLNGGDYLEACISSVQGQTYPRVEHIVQDGGSTDNSLEILNRHEDKLQFESRSDRGESDALNRALRRANGEILVVLNSDDELLPHACSWAVDLFEKYPEIGAVYGDQININSRGEFIKESRGPDPYDYDSILCCETVIPAQTCFIRKSSWQKAGFYINTRESCCPDYDLWIRLGIKSPLHYDSQIVARYRWHQQSKGRSAKTIQQMIGAKLRIARHYFKSDFQRSNHHWLRLRAYSGILLWGAVAYIYNRNLFRGLAHYIVSVLLYPRRGQIPRYQRFIADWLLAKKLFVRAANNT